MSGILVVIPTWRDAELLRGALESVAAAGLPALVCDGRYETYAQGGPWATPEDEIAEAVAGVPDVTVRWARRDRAWTDEAEKKSDLARGAIAAGADWLLFLDADERLETEPGALAGFLRLDPRPLEWAYVNLYLSSEKGVADGYPVPRLLRARDGLHFRPPRDFDAYVGEERVVYLDGEHVPEELADAWTEVPRGVLRIRHDRHLRGQERLEMSGRYVRERRRLHGVA